MEKNQNNEITWRAADREYRKDNFLFEIIIGIVAVFLVILNLKNKNFFFAIFVIVATLVLISLSRQKPKIYEFKISQKSIEIDNLSLAYENLENFSVRQRPGRLDEIIIRKKTTFNPYIRIPIDSKLLEKAKEIINQKLPQIEYKESLFDTITDIMKF